MICPVCRAQIDDMCNFCTDCGAPIPSKGNEGMSGERTKQAEDATPSTSQLKSVQKPQESISRPGMQQGQQVQPQQAQRPSSVQPVSSTPMTMPQTTSQPQANNSKGSKNKSAIPKKGNSPVQFIALGVSVVALILAIVGFVVPSMNASNAPKAIDAGTAKVTIKAGETTGDAKILDDNTPYIVVASSVGGDKTFSDVMFSTETGTLHLIAKEKAEKDTTREIMWVAYKQ